jgi:hypothetical protein
MWAKLKPHLNNVLYKYTDIGLGKWYKSGEATTAFGGKTSYGIAI